MSKQQPERESMNVDVVIIGAGPAGLAAACKLMQQAEQHQKELSVVVLEKGSEVGAHILSGALFEPRALNELFPDWQERGAPLHTAVQEDRVLMFKDETKATRIPLWMIPKPMHNDNNYIVSLGDVCRWLGEQAEALGVEIFPGFPAAEVLFDEDGNIKGVATGEMGRGSDGKTKAGYEPGMELHAKITLFAEGCRGHLGKQLIAQFELDKDRQTQHYGIGIKELWEIDADRHQPGLVIHGAGWPLTQHGASGGSFLYHLGNNLVAMGLITDLSYDNPYLSPFDELQRFKHHPTIKHYLENGKRIGYGARAITKGGLNALPKMCLPNGLLIGCDAGTLNFSKIKGSHTAMKSGMIAAETVFNVIHGNGNLQDYQSNFESSWLYQELERSKNFGAALHKFGIWMGGAYNFIDQNIFSGKLPFKLTDPTPDHEALKPASAFEPIHYAKADGILSFDKTSSVYLSGTNHEEDQPTHLKLATTATAVATNLKIYAGPEQRFCPAGVYEFVETSNQPDTQADTQDVKHTALQINAQNCVHCKTCDIKDPTKNINWVSPEGGGGPNYSSM